VLTSISPIRAIANVVKVGARVSQAGDTGGLRPAGSRDGGEARDEYSGLFQRSRRRSASFTPIRRRARRCWTMPRSTWRAGWRRDRDRVAPGRRGAAFVALRASTAARVPHNPVSRGGRGAAVSNAEVHDVGACGGLSGHQSRRTGWCDPGPGAQAALPPGRGVRDELVDGGADQASSRPRTGRSCGSRGW
jgi:hypothetical protein